MIAIGASRKPTQRIRSFIKELQRVIPGSRRFTRGKQDFTGFCDSVRDLGISRILLVGSFHGNPGRLGFLQFTGETWAFQPPTIIIKSASLLRETCDTIPQNIKRLCILPDTPRDQHQAEILAQALNAPLCLRENLPDQQSTVALLRVGLSKSQTLTFTSLDEKQLLGPSIKVKHFLTRSIGDQKRW